MAPLHITRLPSRRVTTSHSYTHIYIKLNTDEVLLLMFLLIKMNIANEFPLTSLQLISQSVSYEKKAKNMRTDAF